MCALTGVGKTELAAAYARQQADKGCPLVAWVSAGTTDALVAGLAEVARAVGVADPEGDSTKSAVRLRDHLRTRENPALLVIDDAVDADQVRRFLPAVGVTQVIVTSTDHSLAQLGTAVDVSVFDRAQSLAYLRARTPLDDDKDADLVAEELGDLPLALAQAASVVKLKEALSYADYLTELRSMPVTDTLTRRSGDPYPKGTAEAILLSVRTAEATDKSGVTKRLLAVIAVLSPTGTHRDLVRKILKAANGDTTDPASTARVDKMLARLVGLSLLVWGESGMSVIMHRLVTRVVRDHLQVTGLLAATLLDTVQTLTLLQVPEEEAWARREQGAELVPHALAAWDIAVHHTGDDQLSPEQLARCAGMANWAVRHLTVTADLSRASRIGAQVLGECERVLGVDHPATLTSRNNLAVAYRSVGQLDQALTLHKETLAGREQVLGAHHPHTLDSRDHLAYIYELTGQLDRAIPLYEQTLADSKLVQGIDHSDTLTSRNNLARAYQKAGRLDEAIPLFEQNLTDSERELGANHPNTLGSRNNLASAYQADGQVDRAIPLHEQTVVDCKGKLGADDPRTLGSRNNLASAYQKAGRHDEAIPLFEQTLDDRRRVLGAHNPDTLDSRDNLASAYQAAGRLDQAIPLFEKTLADCEEVLGTGHSTTNKVRENLRLAQERYGADSPPQNGT